MNARCEECGTEGDEDEMFYVICRRGDVLKLCGTCAEGHVSSPRTPVASVKARMKSMMEDED